MALNSAAAAFRSAVLSHIRLPASTSTLPAVGSLLPRIGEVLVRGFSGGFLDKEHVTERVLHVAKHFEKVDPAKVSATASFEKDLGLDSLDIVELVMALEEEFSLEIPDAEADKIQTVQEAVNYIYSNPMAK